MADERQDERMLDWLRDGPWEAPAPVVESAVAYARLHPHRTSPFAALRRVLIGGRVFGERAQPAGNHVRFVALGSTVAAVVISAWIAAGSGLFGGGPASGPPAGGAATASPSSTPTPTATVAPTTSPTPAPTAPPTPAPAAGTSSAIGQVVRSEDFTATITSVDFDATGSPAPAEGTRYVSIGMTFTPRPGDGEEFEAADWTLRDASATVYQPVRGVTTADTDVTAGHSLPAKVTFLVPASASHLVLVAVEQTPAGGLPLD